MLPMEPMVPCKLRMKPTTRGPRAPTSAQCMRAVQPSAKKEPELADRISRSPRDPVSNGFGFQQLRSIEIAPSTKVEPSITKQEPKQEPRLKTSKPRSSQTEVIILDNDEPIVPNKEEPLVQYHERCTDIGVIVLHSDDEAVHKPVGAASNARGSSHPPSDDSDAEVVSRRRKPNSGTSKRRGVASDDEPSTEGADLQDGGHEVKSTLEKYLRIIASTAPDDTSDRAQDIQGSRGHSIAEIGTDTNATCSLLEDTDPKLFESSEQVSPLEGSSVTQGQADGLRVERKQLIESPPQQVFDADLPGEWFAASREETPKETEEPRHRPPPPQPSTKDEIQDTPYRPRISERFVDSCGYHHEEEDSGSTGNRTLAQGPTPQTELDSNMLRKQTDEKTLRQRWQKYWVIDRRRTIGRKRRSRERNICAEGGTEEHIAGSILHASEMKKAAEEESDVDPDVVNFSPTHRPKRRSHGTTQRAEKDRDARAQRRAAEAEGAEVPYSQMLDRKPRTEEHKANVIIKVREARKNVEYIFVKSRKASFRDLREELELCAEVPPNIKFELKYKNKVLKDADNASSLGILHTAKIRAMRKERADDDSSDGVSEVEKKKHRENLIKVTVQDENGKNHTFQHDKQVKFRNLFHAFAKMCQNDIRSYRFFFDGKRLSYDDRPVDCEEFEDGALIDAFFETMGGRRT